jgi:hypothetical protein
LPQSVISEHITITQETLAKQGIPGQNKEKQNNDKSAFHLPWQYFKIIWQCQHLGHNETPSN